MSEKVYSYVVMGLITGEHYIEDLKLRVPYRTPMPITEEDFLSSKDLCRAVQQNLVKVVAQASIPSPTPHNNVLGLERRIESLQSTLAESERARKELEVTMAARLANQEDQLSAILRAIKEIPATQTVVVQGTGNGHSSPKQSEVVGGEVPMFIPDHTPIGTDARIQMTTGEGQADLGEAARKLRELRKAQAPG
jgi:hypothetical protein